MGITWTFEEDNEPFDGEFETLDLATGYAYDKFIERCNEDSPENGQHFYADVEFIERKFIEDIGDYIEIQRVHRELEYIYYHGDRAEHFRQGDYI